MWKKRNEKSDITAFTQPHDHSDFDRYKVVMRAQGLVASYVALMQDVDRYTEFMHTTYKAQLVETLDNRTQIIYLANKNFGIKNRDYYVRSVQKTDPQTNEHLFEWSLEPGYTDVEQHVRVQALKVTTLIMPLSGDRVEIEQIGHVEPGGSVPSFLANQLLTEVPMVTMANIRRIVTR